MRRSKKWRKSAEEVKLNGEGQCRDAMAGWEERVRCSLGILSVKKQEGWLSPTERASVSAISLRHIIWLPHESHTGMLLPSAVAGECIWLRQDSLRHILASHG